MAVGTQAGTGAAELPLIDRDHLRSVAHHIGAGPMRELLAEGAAELADRLDRIAWADADEIVARAHQIAGLAGSLGLPRMAHQAKAIAAAPRTGADPAAGVPALCRAAAPSLAALRDWSPAEDAKP